MPNSFRHPRVTNQPWNTTQISMLIELRMMPVSRIKDGLCMVCAKPKEAVAVQSLSLAA